MSKLKEWYFDNKGYDRERKVIRAFEKWYKANLSITHGSGRNAEEIFGLPYTSSSDFAALWNCQGSAELKTDPQWKFWYLAITDENEIVVGFEREDTGNFDKKEIKIGECYVQLGKRS